MTTPTPTDFLRENINNDLASGRYDRVHTRSRRSPTATCTSATPSRSA